MSSAAEIDRRIDNQRKLFFQTLLAKKRKIRRTWMEISCLTNAHLLQTLPYRAMLGHVGELAAEREAARLSNNCIESDKSDNIDSGASGSGTYEFSLQTDDEETDEGIEEETESIYTTNNDLKSTDRAV